MIVLFFQPVPPILNLSFYLLKYAWPRFPLPLFFSPSVITSLIAFNSPSITQLLPALRISQDLSAAASLD